MLGFEVDTCRQPILQPNLELLYLLTTLVRQKFRPTYSVKMKEIHNLFEVFLIDNVIKPHKSPWSNPIIMAETTNDSYTLEISKKQAHHILNCVSLFYSFFSFWSRLVLLHIHVFRFTNSLLIYQQLIDQFIRTFLPSRAEGHIFASVVGLCIVSETFENHVYWLRYWSTVWQQSWG